MVAPRIARTRHGTMIVLLLVSISGYISLTRLLKANAKDRKCLTPPSICDNCGGKLGDQLWGDLGAAAALILLGSLGKRDWGGAMGWGLMPLGWDLTGLEVIVRGGSSTVI